MSITMFMSDNWGDVVAFKYTPYGYWIYTISKDGLMLVGGLPLSLFDYRHIYIAGVDEI